MTSKIKIKQGVLVGSKRLTQNGFEYTDFLNIPYAKPPVGELRFKSPQPPDPWFGERDATRYNESNICLQFDMAKRKNRGSEDCLYVNVSTPKVSVAGLLLQLLPVMVFIHGGGFIYGNGIAKLENGPEYLIENNVVVVSTNYRLGAFGFANLEIPEIAGNMGLKDQVMALKWVQENIESFGGNKNDVTILGVDAGAASVEYHMLSPLSKGLFHKAIMQSGSTINPWSMDTPENLKNLTLKLAQELGYGGLPNDHQAIYRYLMTQPPEFIKMAAIKVPNPLITKGVYYGFGPTIEKDLGNSDSFISELPYKILKSGKFYKVPVLRGFTDSEGFIQAGIKPHDIKELTTFKNYTNFWRFPLNETDAYYYGERLRHVYDSYIGLDIERPTIDFFGDYDYVSGIITSSKWLVKHGVPLYLYEFAYDGGLNLKALSRVNKRGAAHGDDTAYVIRTEPIPSLTQTDVTVRDRISKMWTDFAKTSNPTPNTSPLIPLYWPPYSSNEQFYMVIDKDLHIQAKYGKERIPIFEEITRKYHR